MSAAPAAAPVIVLAGGHPSEHRISLLSGATCVDALLEAGYAVLPLLIAEDGTWNLMPRAEPGERRTPFPDSVPGPLAESTRSGDPLAVAATLRAQGVSVVLPALHGAGGEDGTIQGFLEVAGFASAGCGVGASAVAVDKVIFKRVLHSAGVPTPEFVEVERGALDSGGLAPDLAHGIASLGWPVVVKPACLGSSVGVGIVRDEAGMLPALREALAQDRRVLVERFVAGLELTAPVLGPADAPRGLPLVEIRPRLAAWFDIASKYEPGGADEICPARIDDALAAEVTALACRIHQLIGASGLSRTDVMIDAAGRPWVLETNTLPGMTAGSLYPKALAAAGITLPAFVRGLIEDAQRRSAR